MLHAVLRHLATLDVKARSRLAGAMYAALVDDIYHACPSVLLAVLPRLAALRIEHRYSRARAM